jgi:predicted AAA+ superfamily ATPase
LHKKVIALIERILKNLVRKSARRYPVITLTGPRQSGKTTLVKDAFPEYNYVSLEDPDQRAFALEDPRGFLGQFTGKVILDEAQQATDLFSYIQTMVDERQAPGQFILTGSSNFLLLKNISQSLAGRCAIFNLLPFSLSELAGRKNFSLDRLGRKLPDPGRTFQQDLMKVIFTGFYPRIHDKGLSPRDWLRNYYRTYVERDVREITNIGDLENFGRFIRMCAGRNGQLVNLSSLSSDCGISHTTVKRWLSILEASFLIFLLRPHHRNFNKRLTKSPKLYFLDTGLLCYLLGIRSPEDLLLHAFRGGVFESLVISEFIKYSINLGEDPGVYFWRDSGGHEIDVILDQGSELIPVEIKSGQTVNKDFFSGIEYWKKISGQPKAPAALIYGGDSSFVRRGVAVYTWKCL